MLSFYCHITQWEVLTIGFCILGCLFSPGLAYSRKVGTTFDFLLHFMVERCNKTLTKDSVSYGIVSTSRKKLASCLKLFWCMDDKLLSIRLLWHGIVNRMGVSLAYFSLYERNLLQLCKRKKLGVFLWV